MFHDKATIHVEAGRGGHGGLSFRREKYVPRGGPDGGDGGRGGDVLVVADPALRDLSAFRRVKWLSAGNGGNGRGSRKHGADGETVEASVPVGTQVLDENGRIVADLVTPGVTYVAARGGGGGRGNAHFATPTRQTPRFAETGLPGEDADLELRLKLVVDAALAGLPNAGKSSLLRRISNAKPKVADYPFTTLEPVLGTVDGPDARQLTIADVPGLIEGAAGGAGLGHEFLAHLERARLLVHVLDASEGDLEQRFRTVDHELAEYGAGLAERPQLVVLNKIDLLQAPPAFELACVRAESPSGDSARATSSGDERIVGVLAASCATGAGIDELKRALFEHCPVDAPTPAAEEVVPEFLEYRPRPRRGPRFRILRTDSGYRVVGTPPPAPELEDALRKAGVKRGAEVEIGEEVLEWQ
jgi:GTP-binding protein